MQVFVGNPTLQHRELHYRVPEQRTTRVVRIAPGRQERLPDDLAGRALAGVIEQLHRVGAVQVNDIGAIALPKALVYTVSPNPIKADALQEGLERDEMARQEIAGAKMEEAGLEAFRIAEAANRGRGVVETSVEIVETTDRGPVKDSVDAEYIVSSKPERRASRKRVEEKR